ncbi:aminotransferase class V-fold PLP-dependent enzyme [Fibrobacter intestinalis]|uniref:Cysteine desulfurase n=2 Tax=Fibrobacter TaxID=832 RepID=A0A1T4LTJ5_9BACT|nr:MULTISPECIES: cysteine desulfurase [Fibrobacter]PBC75280.1 cysteine desulfurase/selenocysteine lyase [Fibrobacter sp. NR9]SJZ57977.1 cysteine desulfurase / selenocysteine lyase [Fibrobacter intestinalis]
MNYNVDEIRKQFPVLALHDKDPKPFAFLDSTATTQKPEFVINAMDNFYRKHYSSIKRGVYSMTAQTTDAYESARKKVAKFINAQSENEIVFTRGTTASINLCAWSYGRKFLKDGDEIVISALEHHANIVSWQLIAEERRAKLKVIPVADDGDLILEKIPELVIPGKTKIVAFAHISNTIGTENPVKEMIRTIRKIDPEIKILIDAAQSAPHIKIDVQDLDCDFLAFSGHKMYGPTGIGVLYGKYDILKEMPPVEGGGEMIDQVTFEKTTFALPPDRFEAGTPPIAEVIGLGAAIDWINQVGIDAIYQHEQEILKYAKEKLKAISGLHILGNPKRRGSLLSFTLDAAHPHDVATLLDEDGIAVRSGHHCAQPVMTRFGIPATIRASFGAYTEKWEIDRLVEGLLRVNRIFG